MRTQLVSLAKYLLILVVWVLASPAAFALRVEDPFPRFAAVMLDYTVIGAGVKAVLIYVFQLHRQGWRRLHISDLYSLLQVIGLSLVILLSVGFIVFHYILLPRSIPLLEALVALASLGGIRLALQLWLDGRIRFVRAPSGRRVLVIGAGDAGSMVIRELLSYSGAELTPVGLIDDDPDKQRLRIMGVPVLGKVDNLPQVVRDEQINEVLIAMPSVSGKTIRHVVDMARQAGVTSRIVPGVYEIISGKVLTSQLREVNLEDLLRREPVRLGLNEIAGYLANRVVLVTGAGGSIGAELVRQIAPYHPRCVVLVGHGEHSLYTFERELDRAFPGLPHETIVASLQRASKVDSLLERYKPDVIFHAGAHKHVPLMEHNIDEAVINNIGGTRNLLTAALRHGVRHFINISSDKAVNPTSIMGVTKRIAEYLVIDMASRAPTGATYASVRFGNVLGSRGSVVPLFRDQITRGGPVTITDERMSRYFMTIPEAAQLVLQAGSLGESAVVYVLDMGDPIRIVDLARDMIRLSGLIPDEDIAIVPTGQRPGEKLYEEPLPIDEGMKLSRHPKIYISYNSAYPGGNLSKTIDDILAAAEAQDTGRIMELIQQLVPSYRKPQE